MIDPNRVSAVLVTRGNVPMDRIMKSIREAGIEDIVLWNNASPSRINRSCYGRYLGIAEAKNEFIYHQDDDLVAPVSEILEAYDEERDRWSIVANNRIDEEWPLTAMGVVFHRDLADCFDDYKAAYGDGPEFDRICDVVFAYRNSYRRIVKGYENLPWHSLEGSSMYLEPGHMAVRMQARAQTFLLPERVAA